jgi:hypothetical protein
MMQESHCNDVADDIIRERPQFDVEPATPRFPQPMALLASRDDDAHIELEAQTLENASAPAAHVLPQEGVARL